MKKLKILLLTDHTSHIKIDSFYDLVNELYKRDIFDEIAIASRGLKDNKPFFENCATNNLIAQQIDKPIHFGHNWKIGNIHIDFTHYNVIFLRIDQPIETSFLQNLKNRNKDIVFINDPIGMIKTNSKDFLLNFSKFTPNILLVDSFQKIKQLSLEKEIVIKPLRAYGGKGISKINHNSCFIENNEVSLKTFEEHINQLLFFDNKVLVMDYLKNVNQGDKRILIVNGEILGTLLRIPISSSWICNLSQGAKMARSEPTNDELKIIEEINPILLKEGIVFYGIDTLVNNNGKRVLSEINTANVGGLSAIENLYDKPATSIFVDKIIQYLQRIE